MRKLAKTIASMLFAAVIITVENQTFHGQNPNANPAAFQKPSSLVRGRVLVKFRPQVTPASVREHLSQVGAVEEGQIVGIGVHVLRVPAAAEEAVARALANRPDVEFAEADQLVEPDRIPNDPGFLSEWHLTRISAPTAWNSTIGSSNVTIAILDTGVDGAHPDLSSRMVPGWNFYDNNSDTRDVYGHGTAVAGTAAAATDNFEGVSSVCWNCRIMPIRISDPAGYATYEAVANGLTWAADRGARIANLSYMMTDSSTVRSAAQYFQQRGGVVTVSAGNYSTFDPASDNPYVLTVSATNSLDFITSWSNTGNNVDLSAPGESIFTTQNGGGYGWSAGTSFSAPIVAGIAALVKSANPSLSGSQIQTILKNSADDLASSGWDPTYGAGRVNAAAAVAQAMGSGSGFSDTTPPVISFIYPAAGATISGSITVEVSASDSSGVAAVSLTSPQPSTDSSAPYTFPLNTMVLPAGLQTIMATAKDNAGNTATASILVTVLNIADGIAPVPAILSPVNGSTVNGNITINAIASDPLGVVRMEVWIDATQKAASNSGTITTRWNTRQAAKGSHNLTVKAFDASGNVGITSILVYR